MNPKSLVYCLIIVLLLAGCASRTVQLKPPHPYGTDLSGSSYSWHHLRFKWHWPQEQAPIWPLDLLAADRVMSRVIERYQSELPLWRFHRRAGRDAAGHQFSFIFYTSDETAREIHAAVAANPVTRRLEEHGLLEDLYVTRPDRASTLPATSDDAWPEDLQETWPMFIMGVSQTWLGLVEIHARDGRIPDEDMEELLQHYIEASRELNEIWEEYAQHAFIHHLSGVFGYRPMIIRKRMAF